MESKYRIAQGDRGLCGRTMADQNLYAPTRMFTLDLHGVKLREAERILRARLHECFRYGLRTLRVIFGSPDRLEGTILQAACEIVREHEDVLVDELPTWVRGPEEGQRHPIFLAVPIRQNRDPEPLDASTWFQKFRAEDEKDEGQRLLCEMPYQPFRPIYEWHYGARAIGRGCTAEALGAMCSDLKIGAQGDTGLDLRSLMEAARRWTWWQPKKSLPAKPIASALAEPVVPEPVASTAHSEPPLSPPAVEELADNPGSLSVSAEVYWRLADRITEEADYDRALDYLEQASSLVSSDGENFEVSWRRGRVLLRMHDERCETWLLKADEVCVRIYGEKADQRRMLSRMLTDWYAASGEPDRVIEYARIAGSTFDMSRLTPLERFRHCHTSANLLQAAGRYSEALELVDLARWTLILGRSADEGSAGPGKMGVTKELLERCGIPMRDLTADFLLGAKILRRLKRYPEAWNEIQMATHLAAGLSNESRLQAEIALESGTICRQTERPEEALEFYARAHTLNNGGERAPDIALRYLINLSSGVVYAIGDQPRMARKAYERARLDMEELYAPDHPEWFELLCSQATLCLRCREFEECVVLARRAAEILQLKTPNRHGDIGVALLRSGTALNHLGRYADALHDLEEAQREFAQAIPGTPQHLLPEVERQLMCARTQNGSVRGMDLGIFGEKDVGL